MAVMTDEKLPVTYCNGCGKKFGGEVRPRTSDNILLLTIPLCEKCDDGKKGDRYCVYCGKKTKGQGRACGTHEEKRRSQIEESLERVKLNEE